MTPTGRNKILNQFDGLSLSELNEVKLLTRRDTKMAFSIQQLPDILEKLRPHYQILDVEGVRLNTYESLYYDSPDLDAYTKHHNQKSNRFKVRYRRYLESKLSFFEIKKKSNKGQTIKSRIAKNFDAEFIFDSADIQLINKVSNLNSSNLEPALWVYYKRMTLSNHDRSERLTIDIDLGFQKHSSDELVKHHDLVIMEFKQGRFNRLSTGIELLHKERIYPMRISKYCLGILSCFENIRANRFKEKLMKIAKITNNDRYRSLVS